jgi:F-type H+-transporting ATPase subunit a
MAQDTKELIGHVKDAQYFHLPNGTEKGIHVDIPQPAEFAPWLPQPKEILARLGVEQPPAWLAEDWHLTKFMLLEVVAAVLLLLIFVPLARRIVTGERPTGRLWNLFEAMLLFIRDEVARPAIGGKGADRFLPFLWTIFFFVLFCNLLGMIPWAGSPTGAIACTGALAIMTLVTVLGAGMKKYGVVGFWLGQVPHMELPLVLAVFIKPMIFLIEILGIGIKHFVLSVRLLANMFAGHLVLAVILSFIHATAGSLLWWGVMPASILGATALSLLELFVAFLQAYIFAFLSALFIGMATHQH